MLTKTHAHAWVHTVAHKKTHINPHTHIQLMHKHTLTLTPTCAHTITFKETYINSETHTQTHTPVYTQ